MSAGGDASHYAHEVEADRDFDLVGVLTSSMSRAASAPYLELLPPLLNDVALLDSNDEDLDTFLHLGRGPLHEQVWHVTGDCGMHRHDVEFALGRRPTLTPERAADMLGWLIGYLHPVVETQAGWDRPPAVRLIADDASLDVVAGSGESRAVVRGSGRDLLMLLWRRPIGPVSVEKATCRKPVDLDRIVCTRQRTVTFGERRPDRPLSVRA